MEYPVVLITDKNAKKPNCTYEIIIQKSYVLAKTKYGNFKYFYKNYSNVVYLEANKNNEYAEIIFVDENNKYNPYYEEVKDEDFMYKIYFYNNKLNRHYCNKESSEVYRKIKEAFELYRLNKENDIIKFKKEDYLFYNLFYEKYKIDFDEFKKNFIFLIDRIKGTDSLMFQNGLDKQGRNIYAVAYSNDYLVCIKDYYSSGGIIGLSFGFTDESIGHLLYKDEIDEQYIEKLNYYSNKEIFDKTMDKVIIPLNKLKYIEPYSNLKVYNKTSDKTNKQLVFTENIFGSTVSIGNQIKNNTILIDSSGYKCYFEIDCMLENELYFDEDIVKKSKELQNLIMMKSKEVYERNELAKRLNETINSSQFVFSIADEIEKLKKLFDNGVISEEEFEKIKTKLLNK